MGNLSISPNAPMTSQTFTNLINQALGGTTNGGLSAAAKNAVGTYLKNNVSTLGSSGSASIVPCFDAPWNGK
jgi:DNA gyrase/topoisomerase IV subunit B